MQTAPFWRPNAGRGTVPLTRDLAWAVAGVGDFDGGSWSKSPRYLRSAKRNRAYTGNRGNDVGSVWRGRSDRESFVFTSGGRGPRWSSKGANAGT